jgi:hypothetical protein
MESEFIVYGIPFLLREGYFIAVPPPLLLR